MARRLRTKQHSLEKSEKAIRAVRDQGINLTLAGNIFKIPPILIFQKIIIQEVSSIQKSNLIDDWVKKISRAGFFVRKDQIVTSVSRLIRDLNQNNQIGGWFTNDLVRLEFFHQQPLSERLAEAETSSRAGVSEDHLQQWFMDVNDYIEEKGLISIFEDGSRIFNVDEIAFFPMNRSLTREVERESVRVLMAANAAGQLVPPMVPTTSITQHPMKWYIGKLDSGSGSEDIFFEYIKNIFHPWLISQNIPLPVILFIDGHSSNVTHRLSQFCSANSIELVAYPNTTYVLQPMDIGVFNPLKCFWEMERKIWLGTNHSQVKRKEEFSFYLNKVLEENLSNETVIEGFKRTGLIDLDPDKINFSSLLRRETLSNKLPSCTRKRRFNGLLKDTDSSILKKVLQQGITTGSTDGYNDRDGVLLTDGDESRDELTLENKAVVNETPSKSVVNEIPGKHVVNERPCTKQHYSLENLKKAIDVVLYEGLNYKHVANTFNIPPATLYNKIIRQEISSIEESNLIVDWVKKIARAGFSVSKDQIVTSVLRLIKDLNQNSLIGGWSAKDLVCREFFKNQPYLTERVAEAETSSRVEVREDHLRQWFTDVNDFIKEKGLIPTFEDGRKIFNVDEIAFFLAPNKNTVMAKKSKNHSLTREVERESMRVLMAANAAGQLVPLMGPTTSITQHPMKWSIGKLDSGTASDDIFFEYIKNIFHPWLILQNIPLPVILFIDGHSSNVTYRLSQFCSANSIELVAYPKTTYVLQPMDIGVFNPLKVFWESAVKIWERTNQGQVKRKEHFSFFLNKVLKENLRSETIIEGFKRTGLIDLNPDKINFSSLLKEVTLSCKPSSCTSIKNKRRSGLLKDIDSSIGLKEVGLSQLQEITTEPRDGTLETEEHPLTGEDKSRDELPLEDQTVVNERAFTKQSYSGENIESAIHEVRDLGLNLEHVAKSFKIPPSTLYDKIIRKEILSIKEGNLIFDWVMKIARIGFSVSEDQIVSSVLRLIKVLNQNNLISGWSVKSLVSREFFQHQPYLSVKVAAFEITSRAEVSEDHLRKWFTNVNIYIKEKGLNSIFENGRRIFNIDEIAFLLATNNNNTVMAKKSKKKVEIDKLRVLLAVNAAGQLVPPIFPTTSITGIGISDSGSVLEDTVFEYIKNIFHPWLISQNIPLPVILFINNHSPYVTYHLSEFCSANSIELVPYPNATYVLQPIDIGVFIPMKSYWASAGKIWLKSNQGQVQRKTDFSFILNKVLKENLRSETIIEGFKKTGLVDLDPDEVNLSSLLRKGTLSTKVSNCTSIRKRRFNGELKDIDSSIGLKEVGSLQKEITTGSTDGNNVRDDVLLIDGDEGNNRLPLGIQTVVNERPSKPDRPSPNPCDKRIIAAGQVECNGFLKDIDSSIGLEKRGLLQQEITTGSTDGNNVRDDVLIIDGDEGNNRLPLGIQTVVNERPSKPDRPSPNPCDKRVIVAEQMKCNGFLKDIDSSIGLEKRGLLQQEITTGSTDGNNVRDDVLLIDGDEGNSRLSLGIQTVGNERPNKPDHASPNPCYKRIIVAGQVESSTPAPESSDQEMVNININIVEKNRVIKSSAQRPNSVISSFYRRCLFLNEPLKKSKSQKAPELLTASFYKLYLEKKNKKEENEQEVVDKQGEVNKLK